MKIELLKLNLTSNNSNGCIVTTDAPLLSMKTQPYYLFDGLFYGMEPYRKDDCSFHTTNYSGDKSVLLKLPKPIKIVKLSIGTRYNWYYGINTLTVYGSNDGKQFEQILKTDATKWKKANYNDEDMSMNTKSYLYYKFTFNSGSYVALQEIALYQKASLFVIRDKDNYIINNEKIDLNKTNLSELYNSDKLLKINEFNNINKITSNYNVVKIK